MATRKDYLDGNVTHEAYYSQLVTPEIKNYIAKRFGIKKLRDAFVGGDTSLNTISMNEWDALSEWFVDRESFKQYGDFWSLGSGVCVCKQAAREVVEESKTKPFI